MRPIKFRGKSLNTGEWVYGALLQYTDRTEIHYYKTDEDGDTAEWWHAVDPKTVGQCTGMKDRTGRDIYEGDIVSWLVNGIDGLGRTEVGHVEWIREEVQFRIANRFPTRDGRILSQSLLNRRDLTVHDNIHDIGVS